MRSLLILITLSASAIAQIPNGAGPQPPVTSKHVPEFINEAMRDVLRDPPALYYRRWTQPELRSYLLEGKPVGFWSMEIVVIAPGGLDRTYKLTIENLKVTRILRIDQD